MKCKRFSVGNAYAFRLLLAKRIIICTIPNLNNLRWVKRGVIKVGFIWLREVIGYGVYYLYLLLSILGGRKDKIRYEVRDNDLLLKKKRETVLILRGKY